MQPPDLELAIRSVEISSVSLRRQMAEPGRRTAARSKLEEALGNHQRTLGRLVRMRPLQQLALVMSVGWEIGMLREAAQKNGFAPDSAEWGAASKKWRALHAQALAEADARAQNSKPNTEALRKAFGLAVLSGAIALFLDEKAPLLSERLRWDRYKTAGPVLALERMI